MQSSGATYHSKPGSFNNSMARDSLLFVLISVALSVAQVIRSPSGSSSPVNSIKPPASEDVYSALVQVSIRCKNDPYNGLTCAAEYPDQCKEQWNFPNPCTQNNLDRNINRFVHPFDKTKFLMCGQLGKLYVVQCPQHEIFHDGCGECGDARNTAYCSEVGSGSSGSGNMGNMGSGSGGSGNMGSGSISIEGIVGNSGIGNSGGSIMNGISSGIGGGSGMGNNDGSVLSGIISSSGGGSGMGNSGDSIMNGKSSGFGGGSRMGNNGGNVLSGNVRGSGSDSGMGNSGGSVKSGKGIIVGGGSGTGSSGDSVISGMNRIIRGGSVVSKSGGSSIDGMGGKIGGIDGVLFREGTGDMAAGNGAVGDIGVAGIGSIVDGGSSNSGSGESGTSSLHILQYNICTRDAILANKLFFPFPGNVSKFIHCDIWGKPWERVCTTGEVWSTLDVTCVLPHLLNPCNRPSTDLNYLYLHPCDQSKYLVCDTEGQAHEIDCARNEAFNETLQQCQSINYFTDALLGNYCGDYKFGFKKSAGNSGISLVSRSGGTISGMDTLSQQNTNNKDTGLFQTTGREVGGITTHGSQRNSAGFIIERVNKRSDGKSSVIDSSRQDQNSINMHRNREMNPQGHIGDVSAFDRSTQFRGDTGTGLNAQGNLGTNFDLGTGLLNKGILAPSRQDSIVSGFNDGTASNFVDNAKSSFSNGLGTAEFVDIRKSGMVGAGANLIEKTGNSFANNINGKGSRSSPSVDIGSVIDTGSQSGAMTEMIDIRQGAGTDISGISAKDVSGSIFKLTDHGTSFGRNVGMTNRDASRSGFIDKLGAHSGNAIDSQNRQTLGTIERGSSSSTGQNIHTKEGRKQTATGNFGTFTATGQSSGIDTQLEQRGMTRSGKIVNQRDQMSRSGVGEAIMDVNRKGNFLDNVNVLNRREGTGTVKGGRLDEIINIGGQVTGILNGRTLGHRSDMIRGTGTSDLNSRSGSMSLNDLTVKDSGRTSTGLMTGSRSGNIQDIVALGNHDRLSNIASFDLKNQLGLNGLTGMVDTMSATSKAGTTHIDGTNQTGGKGTKQGLLTWDQIIGGGTAGRRQESITGKAHSQGGTPTNAADTIHPSRLRMYPYSEILFSEPCTKLNIEAGRTHFKLEGFPHMFLQCDTAGRMHKMPCSGNDWFDVYTNTCVDGPVHVKHTVIKP